MQKIPTDSTLIGESPRIYVRTWSEGDVPTYFTLAQNEGLNLFSLRGYRVPDLATARAKILEQQNIFKKSGMGNFGIFLTHGDALESDPIGICAIRPIQVQGRETTELMFRLHPVYWGKAFAVDISQICIQYGFNKLHRPEIVATVNPLNQRSKRVMQKIGLNYLTNIHFHDVELELYQRLRPTGIVPDLLQNELS